MKATKEWLQNHLEMPMRRALKMHSPNIRTGNGGSISAQASQHHYCSPKADKGPYSSIEILCHNLDESDLYSLPNDEVHGWVSVETVVSLINNNGGIKEA